MASTIWAVLGVTIAIFAISTRSRGQARLLPIAGLAALFVVVATANSLLVRFTLTTGSGPVWTSLALAAASLVMVSVRVPRFRFLAIVTCFATVVFATLIILIPNWEPIESSDVYRGHDSAGHAMMDGLNPYSDAVRFRTGDPTSPRRIMEGYSYPPVALLAYGGASVLTDPRIISAAAWIGLVAWLGVKSWRSNPVGDRALAALVIISTAPLWKLALFMGWTEPLSVALLVAGFWLLPRRRYLGAIWIAAALASKQYFIAVAPALLTFARNSRWRVVAQVGFGAAVLGLFPLLWGPSDYYRAVVQNVEGGLFRPDSQSINGLIATLGGDFRVSLLAAMTIVGVGGLYAGYKAENLRQGAQLVVIPMALLFLTTTALPNYWFMVMALSACAPLLEVADDTGSKLDSPLSGRPNVTQTWASESQHV